MATSTQAPVSFDTQLSNVRRLTASNQAHQAKPAQLLVAIEQSISATLPGSTLPHSSTAYFSALLQCLEKACADEIAPGESGEAMAETEKMGNGDLIPATLYLLAIVVPETPAQVVLSKLSPVLENLLPLYDTALEHPPALRSLIQITTQLILFATPSLLQSSPLLKRAWNYLLELNLDPRPKVRHLAQEGMRKVLTTPIPPKLTPNHPYLPRAREWVTKVLDEEVRTGGSSKPKGKKTRFADSDDAEGKKAIWIVQGLRGWVAVWGDEQLSQLCQLLLTLPPHAHLTSQVFSLLAHLLTPPPADSTSAQPAVMTNLPTIVNSLLGSTPELNSPDLPAYLSALSSALIKMSLQDPLNLPSYLPKAFNLIFNEILLAPSTSRAVCSAAADAISNGIVRYCVNEEGILASIAYLRAGSHVAGARKKQKTPFLTRLITAVTEGLDSHALRMEYLFQIITALISRLRIRVTPGEAAVDPNGRAATAAEELLMPLIKEIGDLRSQKGFELKEKVDEVVGMAIEVVGVEGVLNALPLNIEPDASGRVPQPGRAHLLPIIRQRTTNDSLAFFTTYFRQLSESLFERKVAAEDNGKASEAKVWEVVIGQIWDCLPGFCEMPRDMIEGLSGAFLSLITNLLYTQPLLLSSLLRSLSQLVKSNEQILVSGTAPQELRRQFGVDQEAAKANMDKLRTLAKDMVSVLLNVFSKLPREQRGMVSDVIASWVGIMDEKDLIETYNTVTGHLSANLGNDVTPAPGSSPISHTMLDLLIVFVPALPAAQSSALFQATATKGLLEHKDATVQKKAYRLLKRLIEAGKLGNTIEGEKMEQFVTRLNECATGVGPGAQRDRLQLLATVVEALPKDRLSLIPELLSEAVLGTKEVNEKARDAGFDLLVVMGFKMAEGGMVNMAVEGDEGEMAENSAEANAEEYITMVAAGLTGTTPHMISASINALSRLLFEFREDISKDLISELVATIVVFVGSKNREIVKSALGFVKVAVVALPIDTVEPHLDTLVPALLGWVHDHKNHFKSKTVHIFERMIRKFGFDTVYKHAPEGDERKVLTNIKRRKERAKRKKAGAEGDAEEGGQAPKTSSGNAFDDILYNSDSDLESDGEDNEDKRPVKPLSKRQQKRLAAEAAAYIRNEGEEPMDLLSRSIAGGVSRADPTQASRKRQPGQDAKHFQTDKSGKLVIEESGDEADGDDAPRGDAGEGTAYLSAMRGADGATRDAKGVLRFNKNTKRAREADREDDAMDVDDFGAAAAPPKKAAKKKTQAKRLGEEFRSKRAGGDVKRNADGPDPFSYVPIDQAARRGGRGGEKVNLTNKKRGSRQ